MDDIVKQAMAKWPNVPNVYGWLGLDRRGVWRIKGDTVTSPVIAGFISRNYDHDEQGRWFFQNGPQRVFVTLDYAPFVYHIVWNADPATPLCFQTHTGAAVKTIASAWIDESGVLLLLTEYGAGMVDDRNLERLLPAFTDASGRTLAEDEVAERIERLQAGGTADIGLQYAGACAPLNAIAATAVAAKFGFVRCPQTPAGEEICN